MTKLPEKDRRRYNDIIANGDVVSKHTLCLPETVSVRPDMDGKRYSNHLYTEKDKDFATIRLNSWEDAVIAKESTRPDFVCWLRNPPQKPWALCLPYEMEGETRSMYPDFIVIRQDAVLRCVIDVLEPHNPGFKDNLGKAKALAEYARDETGIGRVQLIRMVRDAGANKLKRLDLSLGKIREKVMGANNTDELDHIFEKDGFFDADE